MTTIANEFIQRLEIQVPKFLQEIEASLPLVKELYCDHVCWRTDSIQDYEDLVSDLKAHNGSTLLVQSIVSGRPIATFELKKGIQCNNNRLVTVVEIPAPKFGSPYSSGLEHAEFVISSPEHESERQSPINDTTHRSLLEEFVQKNLKLNLNEKAKNKTVNPDVSLKLNLPEFGRCSVKFHLFPLAKVIEYEIVHGMADINSIKA